MADTDGNSGDRRSPRVVARPNPGDWGPTEILRLSEAVDLFWPSGPLTVRSLRTAVRDGALDVTWIAGKMFTTPQAILDMTRCSTDPSPTSPAAADDGPGGAEKANPREALRFRGRRMTPASEELMRVLKEERDRVRKPPRGRRSG